MTLSLIGIVIAVIVFIFMAFKRINLLFNTVVASVIIIGADILAGGAVEGTTVLTALTGTYMAGFSAFMKGYLFLFMLSGVFGKFMTDSGCARAIALGLASLVKKSKNNQKFFTILILPIFYFILSYAGVSGFVLVFTVISIGRELFEECDIPWKFYCYGSAGIYPALVMGGSAYSTNIIATQGYGVDATAAMGLSAVLVAVIFATLAGLIMLDVKKAEKEQEGFLPSGEHIKKLQLSEQIAAENLPSIVVAIIPLLTTIILIIFAKANVLVALTAACIVVLALCFSKFTDLKKSLSEGIVSAGVPLIFVSGAVGLTTIIKTASGFQIVIDALDSLPGMMGGILFVMLVTGVVASSSSSLPSFISDISGQMLGAGLSAEVAARMTVVAGMTYMGPHNPGVINAIALSKIDFKKASMIYFKSTFVPGIVATIVGVILISVGIF